MKALTYFVAVLLALLFKAELHAEPMYVTISAKEAVNVERKLRNTPDNVQKVNMLLDLAYFHMEKPIIIERKLDTANLLLRQATSLAGKLDYLKGTITCQALLGLCSSYMGKDDFAIKLYQQAIAGAAKSKFFELEGRSWHLLGLQQNMNTRIISFKKAIECYRKVKDYGRIGHLKNRILFIRKYALEGQYFPGYFPISAAFIPSIKKELNGSINENKRIDLLLRLASIYIYRPGQEKMHLDSALLLINLAQGLSKKIGNQHGYNESLLLKSSAYREKGKMHEVDKILKILTDTSKIKLLTNFSNHYSNIAGLNSGKDRKLYLDSSMIYYQLALKQSVQIKSTRYSKEIMKKIIEILDALSTLENIIPEQHYALVAKYAPTIGFPSKARLFSLYAAYYNNTGNFYKALYYTHLMEKNLKTNLDYDDTYWVYYTLVAVYKNKNDLEKTNEYYLRIIDLASKYYNTIIIYSYVNAYVKQLILLKQTSKAKQYLTAIIKRIPFRNDADNVYYYVAMGNYFKALNNLREAEKNYKLAILHASKGWESEPKFELSELYTRSGKFTQANETLSPYGYVAFAKLSKANMKFLNLQARIDSGLGNFKSAYLNLSAIRKLNDSIYAVSKDRHTQELEFQYQTQMKEADLRTKDLNIRILQQKSSLLTQASKTQEFQLKQAGVLAQKNISELRLKEKNIALLNESARLRESILEKQDLQRKVALGAVGMLTLLSVLLWRLYYIKRISNTKLNIQQQKIEASNNSLQHALQEKDWLLKEIHHRVKNNLHMVMSLLESQSAYLQEDALQAIQNSQHRIYAMSLIHQKLYLSDEVKTIKILQYIMELVEYLKDSFEIKDISFCLDIDDIEVDIATAVPLGLILNEAITNSIKYAFDSKSGGKITVSLKAMGKQSFNLIIEDNGKGLPRDFDMANVNSLGLKLIKGLSAQIEGHLIIENLKGTKIIISSILANHLKKIHIDERNLDIV